VIAATGKLVGPEDILVLVRSRNGFFDALIRELRQADVPVAGADRLKLIESIAVLDLLALARFSLMPEDDHALACILKSPVLAAPFTEDQLMSLAIGRGDASLWQALRASDAAHCRAAAAQLGRLAAHAATARAFEFFSGVLMQARLRFLSRLGSEANDALDALLDAALAYEQNHAASLAGFVNWFETGGVEIKRNMEQAAGEVRIMTVHGAKGLEAPIVILPDTASMPDSHTESPLVMVEAGNSGIKLPLWKLPKRFESAAFRTLRARVRDSRDDEYQRLLYVAMTRARDELYICGYRGIQQPKNGCWHETASRALRPVMREVEDGESRLWRLGPDPQYRDAAAAVRAAAGPLPEWIGHPHTEDLALPEPLAVSALARREAAPAAPPERLNRGIAIHRILQRLPGLEEGARTAEARRMAAAAGLDPALGDDLAALTEAPGLRHLFAADGLSEVPLAAALPDLGLTVTGRIDRLILGGDGIIAVDFKTTADPPASPGAVNPGDLVQLACYRAALRRIHPGAPVSMALLHTETKSLMVLPDSLLDQALDQIAVNRP